jgi:hypothetical protein
MKNFENTKQLTSFLNKELQILENFLINKNYHLDTLPKVENLEHTLNDLDDYLLNFEGVSSDKEEKLFLISC